MRVWWVNCTRCNTLIPTKQSQFIKQTPSIFFQNFSVSQLKTSNSDSSDPRSASLTSITAADRFTSYTPSFSTSRSDHCFTPESNRLRYVHRSPFSNLISLSAMCCDRGSAFLFFIFLIFMKPLSFSFSDFSLISRFFLLNWIMINAFMLNNKCFTWRISRKIITFLLCNELLALVLMFNNNKKIIWNHGTNFWYNRFIR